MATKNQQSAGISLRPSTFVQGGLLSDADVQITEARIVMWDYDGKIAEFVPACRLTLQPLDGNSPEGDPVIQHWSAGSSKDFVANEEETGFVAVGSAQSLRKGSNFAILLSSLTASGFPEERMDNDITVLESMVMHVTRVQAPKRSGGGIQQKDDAQILVCSEIKRFPWEKGKTSVVKAGPAKSAAAVGGKTNGKAMAAAAPADDGLDTQAQEVLGEIVAEKDGTVNRATVSSMAFKKLMKDPNRGEILNRFKNDEWLAGACEALGLVLEGSNITVAA